MWVFFSLIAATLTSFLPIINKRLLTDTDVSVVAWGFNAFSLPILGLATIVLLPVPQVDTLFWMGVVGSGILNMVATLLSTQALKQGDASLVTPFLTFNPIFTLLIALFTLGEIPNLTGVLGVVVIAFGAYMFAVEEAEKGLMTPIKALVRQRALVLAILASFVWGLTPIFEKVAIQHSTPQNPPLIAFATTLVMSVLLLPAMMLRSREPLHKIMRRKPGFFAAAVIAGIAPIFGFTAIALGYVGYVTALFKLSPVFTVILAAFLLKESNIGQRLLGAAVMATGAIILAL